MSFSSSIRQLSIDDLFDGQTIDPDRDEKRLKGQHKRVFDLMRDGKWRTLAEISHLTGDPETSISSRLRDYRKAKWGGHSIEREYVENGLFRYRLLLHPNYGI